MFRNYFMASVRNLARNRLHSAISIFGLAIGVCGAMLAGVVLHAELTCDRFIPGYERIYLAEFGITPAGRARNHHIQSPIWLAAQMRLKFPEIDAATRVAEQVVSVRRGEIQANENIGWADPNAFDVLKLPVAFGELTAALKTPDSVVLTRDAARKYFGRENAIGETIDVDGAHPMKVTAILENLPAGSELIRAGLFASALAPNSVYSVFDTPGPYNRGAASFRWPGRTYLRLRAGTSIERLRRALPEFSRDTFPLWLVDSSPSIELIRLDRVHLFPGFHPDVNARLTVVAVVGTLILMIACLNFINLTTARSARRALEVGVRKAAGADRRNLMAQFLGEALIYVLVAAAIAAALTEWLLPHINAFLDTNVVSQFWREPKIVAVMFAGVIAVGLIAGAYPAFILSSFRPAGVIRAARGRALEERVRQWLVSFQFAVLMGLIIAAGVTYQQLRYATRDILRVDTDQMLVVRAPCEAAFKNGVSGLPGVRGVGCASESFLTGVSTVMTSLRDGSPIGVTRVEIEPGVLELFGLKPTAGRFFTAGRNAIAGDPETGGIAGPMLLNQTAVEQLGFGVPAAAIGRDIPGRSFPPGLAREIIGTVPDFSLAPATNAIAPTVYTVTGARLDRLFIKLSGHDLPETLAAIDTTWRATGHAEPIDRVFLNDYIQKLYLSVQRQTQTLMIFSGCALLLACLGLIGLAASAAERRTREIGVRKAMGAGTRDVMRLLVWQTTKPVLWANVIAWPTGAFLMQRWLEGFAYHVDLDPRVFVGASAIAMLLALITVGAHCYRVALHKPVDALRYE